MFKKVKLLWKLRKLDRHYLPRLKKLRAEGNDREHDALLHKYWYERDWIEEDWRLLYQSKITRKARRFLIPVPAGEGTWEQSRVIGWTPIPKTTVETRVN